MSITLIYFLCSVTGIVGFVGELASLLIRNVTYEGPALRRQLAKAQQLQQELSRREVECQSSAADMRERYYAACKQYGIRVSTGPSPGGGTKTCTEKYSEFFLV